MFFGFLVTLVQHIHFEDIYANQKKYLKSHHPCREAGEHIKIDQQECYQQNQDLGHQIMTVDSLVILQDIQHYPDLKRSHPLHQPA